MSISSVLAPAADASGQGTALPSLAPSFEQASTTHLAVEDRSVVAQQRARLPFLVAPAPETLPNQHQVQADLGPARIAVLAEGMAQASAQLVLSATVTQMARPEVPLIEMARRGTALDCELHDAFFGVIRKPGAQAYVDSIIAAAARLKAEARAGAWQSGADDFAAVARGLELAFRLATGHACGPITLTMPPRREIGAPAAARRWMRGHQIFLVLCQAILASVEHLRHDESDAAAAVVMQEIALALDASAAMMRITGDFRPQIYDELIRPVMAPPYLPDGFSGLFSSDHRLLVARLREFNRRISLTDGVLANAHHKLLLSFGKVYDNHISVCSRFVQSDKASLLMNDSASCNAVEQLGKFKRSRMRLLGGK